MRFYCSNIKIIAVKKGKVKYLIRIGLTCTFPALHDEKMPKA